MKKKEIQEVKNAYTAYEQLSEIDPYNIRHSEKIPWNHDKVPRGESGEFRLGEEGFSMVISASYGTTSRFVPQLMRELFDWMKMAQGDIHH